MQQAQNISSLHSLSLFIDQYPDQSMHEKFRLLAESFPTHRAVRGDGNCFYRAFAFLYLSNCGMGSYEEIFPSVRWSCTNAPITFRSDEQFEQSMQDIYYNYIQTLPAQPQARQSTLQSHFNTIPQFDHLLICYFRSKTHQYLSQNRSTLKHFSASTQQYQEQMQRTRNYGSESEGVEIAGLASAMGVKIVIFYVGRDGFQPVQYMEELGDRGFYLFFRPGHYDIVYPETSGSYEGQIRTRDLNNKTGFFTNVKRNFFSAFQRKSLPQNNIRDYKKQQNPQPKGPKISEKDQNYNNPYTQPIKTHQFPNPKPSHSPYSPPQRSPQYNEPIRTRQRQQYSPYAPSYKSINLNPNSNSYRNGHTQNERNQAQGAFDYRPPSSGQRRDADKKKVEIIGGGPQNIGNQIMAVVILGVVGYFAYSYW